jgi:hypothetical protein
VAEIEYPGVYVEEVPLGNTMTQEDIDNVRLNIVLGIAPLKPAQFVIVSIARSIDMTRG